MILDSKGNRVDIRTGNSFKASFANRNSPLITGSQAPGTTMLSKFGAKGGQDINAFKKLASDIQMANPSIRSPLLNQSNFYMPESDSATGEPNRLMNQWITYYVKWHYLVGSILSMHAELPLSRFALRGVDDPVILQFYEDMVENMEMHTKSVEILKQFFTYGEVIPFAHWSDNYNCFTDLTLLDQNYVYVKGHYLLHSDEGEDTEYYELEPDPMLINLVKSEDYVNKLLTGYLDEEFVQAVRGNKRLLLSNFSTGMIRNKLRWSDLRGTSIVLRCLKSLLYSDKLRESQYSVADGHVNPKWLWKIGQAGDLATGGYMPSEEDLTAFRDLLVNANNDPMFTLITHYAVNAEAIGLNGRLLPINADLAQVENEILAALFSNKALTTGEGPTYSNASVAFRALMSRYIPVRAKLERYYYQKIFAPVAYANKFYKRKQADLAHGVRTGDETTNALVIPNIDWRSKSNLLDDGSVKSIISSMVSSGRLPMKILVDALDLDYDEVRNYLYSEQATVFDSVTLEGRKKIAGNNTDETMLGQPYAPKTNQPVSIKNRRGQGAEPKAAKASKLLSVRPLRTAAIPDNPVAVQDPMQKNPVEKAIEPAQEKTATPDTTQEQPGAETQPEAENTGKKVPAGKVFDVFAETISKKQLDNEVIGKKFKAHADKKDTLSSRLTDNTGKPANDFVTMAPATEVLKNAQE